MKPMNWISATGRSPAAAMPTEIPPIASSASGASITRSLPNFSSRPWVARNTPPFAATSSPSTTTLSSSLIARASAMAMAPIRVVSGMVGSPTRGDLLLGIGRRQDRVEMVEHRFRRHGRRRQIALDRRVDLVVAVDLHAGNAGGDRLLGQRAGGGLRRARHRDRPLIVVDHEHRGDVPDAGIVDRLVKGAIRGGAVAADADRGTRLAFQLLGTSDAYRMQALARDRDADRKIVARPLEVAATLIAPPIEQQLIHAHAPPQLRAGFAVGRQQHVLGQHRRGEADR